MMKHCWSEWWNMLAADLALASATIGTVVLVLAPDPTTLTKWAAVGSAVGIIASLAWLISAYIALRDCRKSHGADQPTIDEMNDKIKKLQETQEKLQKEIDKLKGH